MNGDLSVDTPQGTVHLSPLAPADAPDFAAAASGDHEIRRWSSLRAVTDLPSAQAWIASRASPTRLEWAIRTPAGELLGRVALHDLDIEDGTAEIGYGLFAAFRGAGIARSVASAVTEHGFAKVGLRRIELMHAVGNVRSCTLAEACDYPLEGTLRALLDDGSGGYDDAHLHARLSTD